MSSGFEETDNNLLKELNQVMKMKNTGIMMDEEQMSEDEEDPYANMGGYDDVNDDYGAYDQYDDLNLGPEDPYANQLQGRGGGRYGRGRYNTEDYGVYHPDFMIQGGQFNQNQTGQPNTFFNMDKLKEGFLRLGVGQPLHQIDDRKGNWENPKKWEVSKNAHIFFNSPPNSEPVQSPVLNPQPRYLATQR